MTAPENYRRGMLKKSLVPLAVALGCLAGALAGQATLAAILFFAFGCVLTWGTLAPGSSLFGPVTRRLPSSEGVLITIDDGPDPAITPALLEVLDQHQAKALFFLIGERAEAQPALVAEILRRGHRIGNHSMTHPAGTFWCLGPWRMWRELAQCETVLAAHAPHEQRWFRPPVGHHNLFCHAAAKALGLRILMWSGRGFDTVDSSVPRVLRRLDRGLKPGSIVLLHDGLPTSAEVLEGTLKRLASRGLHTAVVPLPGQADS